MGNRPFPSESMIVMIFLFAIKCAICLKWRIGRFAQTGSIAPLGASLETQIFHIFEFAGLARKFLLYLLRL